MKKLLVVMLLAVAMVVPVFATDKGAMEVDVKAGLLIEPILMCEYSGNKYSYPAETTFSLGADFYYYVVNNLGVGAGVNHIFQGKMNENWGSDGKIGATNIYVAVKPVLEVKENKFIDKVYFLGQLGYGLFNNEKMARWEPSEEADNGMYWAIGAGIEKCNVIVELMYSVNYSYFGPWEQSWTYRNIAINVGYKFNI